MGTKRFKSSVALWEYLERNSPNTGRVRSGISSSIKINGDRINRFISGRHPWKDKSGLLNRSHYAEVDDKEGASIGDITLRIGNSAPYAKWLHDGTGIYGKYKTPIVPRTAPYLRFFYMGRWWSKASVKGVKPMRWIKKALQRELPKLKNDLTKTIARLLRFI